MASAPAFAYHCFHHDADGVELRPPEPPVGTFGEKLRNQREQRGITLEAISNSTKISVRMLRALEAEHFEQLPGGVFNKGFVRAYARQVGLDEEEALADYFAALLESQSEAQNIPPDFRSPPKKPLEIAPPSSPTDVPVESAATAQPSVGDLLDLDVAERRRQERRTSDRRNEPRRVGDRYTSDPHPEHPSNADLAQPENRIPDRRIPDDPIEASLIPESRNESSRVEDSSSDHRLDYHHLDDHHLDDHHRSADRDELGEGAREFDPFSPVRSTLHFREKGHPPPAANSSPRVSWRLAAVALLIVAAVAVWTSRRHVQFVLSQQPATAASQPAASAAASHSAPSAGSPKTQVPPPASTATKAASSQPNASQPSGSERSITQSPAAQPAAAPTLAGNTTPLTSAKSPATFTVLIRAEKTTRVSIVADGKPVADETLIAPAHTSVRASREVVVKTANAAGVSFLLNGKLIPAQGNEGEAKTYFFDETGIIATSKSQTPPN